MFKMNIITQLIGFFVMAAGVNWLHLPGLMIISLGLLVIIVLRKKFSGFLNTLLRFKWFFLVLIMIFSFNTPGEHVTFWPFSADSSISPSYEGLQAGLTQLLRIVTILAGLFIIMALNSKQQLISGLYFIFLPLQYLGLKVERFAARLWLTLHYVETQSAEKMTNKANGHFFSQLKQLTQLKIDTQNQAFETTSIILDKPVFNCLDYAAIAILLILIGLDLTKAFA